MSEASQTTVYDAIRRLMPNGTNPRRGGDASWESCPSWPPDAFAVAAYLLEQSGAYARTGLVGSQSPEESQQKTDFARKASELGEEWAKSGGWRISGEPPKAVQGFWMGLIHEKDEPLILESDTAKRWHEHASHLLACADEAGTGHSIPPFGWLFFHQPRLVKPWRKAVGSQGFGKSSSHTHSRG